MLPGECGFCRPVLSMMCSCCCRVFCKIGRMKIRFILFVCLLAAGVCPVSAQPASSVDSVVPAEIKNHWFNGAEISRFELKQVRYGKTHEGHAEFIFVTEPFLTGEQVKHEFGSGESVPVLKLNALRTFNTGIYSYRTMLSVFTPITGAHSREALKTTTSVQDWCGQAFLQTNRRSSGVRIQQFSYFQTEGDRDFDLGDVPLEDGLWTSLRLAPESLPTGELEMVPGSVFLRFRHLPVKAYAALGKLEQSGGQYLYSLVYPEIGRTLEIRFDRKFPHIIRSWNESLESESIRTSAVLKDRIENAYYWEMNQPEDAHQRRRLGLQPVAD